MKTKIPISNKKIFVRIVVFILIGLGFLAVLFIVLLFASMFNFPREDQTNLSDFFEFSEKIYMVSLLGFIIFSLINKKAGLVIDNNGIVDNTNKNKQLILWNDISSIKLDSQQKVILIVVNNPQKYMGKKNSSKYYRMKYNQKKFGTPLIIEIKKLNYNPISLEKLLQSHC